MVGVDFAGCDLNFQEQYGATALFCAAQLGHTDIVQDLVNAGADLDRTDTKGCTPFMGNNITILKPLSATYIIPYIWLKELEEYTGTCIVTS